MKVSERMTTEVSTVGPDTKAAFAFLKMVQFGFRHLPVIDFEGNVWGIVSYGDLREALQLKTSDQHLTIEHFEASPLIQDICTRHITSVTPDMDVRTAAKIMVKQKIGALPVMDDNRKLLGIITESDMLSIFVEIMDLL